MCAWSLFCLIFNCSCGSFRERCPIAGQIPGSWHVFPASELHPCFWLTAWLMIRLGLLPELFSSSGLGKIPGISKQLWFPTVLSGPRTMGSRWYPYVANARRPSVSKTQQERRLVSPERGIYRYRYRYIDTVL